MRLYLDTFNANNIQLMLQSISHLYPSRKDPLSRYIWKMHSPKKTWILFLVWFNSGDLSSCCYWAYLCQNQCICLLDSNSSAIWWHWMFLWGLHHKGFRGKPMNSTCIFMFLSRKENMLLPLRQQNAKSSIKASAVTARNGGIFPSGHVSHRHFSSLLTSAPFEMARAPPCHPN